MEDDPVQVKFECNEVDRCENSRAVHISPHISGTIVDSEKSSINANRKSTMGFPNSHQPRSYVILIPQMGVQNLLFFPEILTKNNQKFATKFHCLKTVSGIVIAQSNICRTVSAFWQEFPVKFGPKGTDPQCEGCACRVSHALRCDLRSALSDLLVCGIIAWTKFS